MHYYVIDQNYFRHSGLVDKLSAATSDDVFVVTDTALAEMCKSGSWESTLRQSLRMLSHYPNNVIITAGHRNIMRHEIDTRVYVRSIDDLKSPRETSTFRKLLREISVDDDNGPSSRGQRSCGIWNTLIMEQPLDVPTYPYHLPARIFCCLSLNIEH